MMTCDTERFKGHLRLEGIGRDGQERICSGHVAVVGCGGLGSAVIPLLAAAGTGHLTLIDPDTVELSNLQRQTIHTPANLGRSKAVSAAEKVRSLSPQTEITAIVDRLTTENAAGVIGNVDMVVDCTDSYTSKSTVAESCISLGRPEVIGAVSRFSGQVMTYLPGTACYHCLYPDLNDKAADETSCATAGIFNAVVGLVGSIQAAETLKFLAGARELLTDRLLTIDALTMQFNIYTISRDRHCRVCGQ